MESLREPRAFYERMRVNVKTARRRAARAYRWAEDSAWESTEDEVVRSTADENCVNCMPESRIRTIAQTIQKQRLMVSPSARSDVAPAGGDSIGAAGAFSRFSPSHRYLSADHAWATREKASLPPTEGKGTGRPRPYRRQKRQNRALPCIVKTHKAVE